MVLLARYTAVYFDYNNEDRQNSNIGETFNT